MIFDDFSAGQNPHSAPSPNFGGSDRRDEEPGQPDVDREVPIQTDKMSVLLNQWLDGEISAATVQANAGGDDAVDLWNKIHDETELLRGRTTPLYVHKRIMDSLPDDLYRNRLPWYRRPVALHPALLVIVALALIGMGVFIAHVATH